MSNPGTRRNGSSIKIRLTGKPPPPLESVSNIVFTENIKCCCFSEVFVWILFANGARVYDGCLAKGIAENDNLAHGEQDKELPSVLAS